jgi:hypothetical protein
LTRLLPRSLAFIARFVCALFLLLSAWPYVARPYGACLATLGNALKPGRAQAVLEFSVPTFEPHAAESFALMFSARQLSASTVISVPIDLRNLAYLPTACLLALALATPLWRIRRGLLLLAAALVLLHIFLVASLAMPLVLLFAGPRPLHLIDLSPLLHAALDVLYRALVAPPGMAYAIPGLLWLGLISLSDDCDRDPGTACDSDVRPESGLTH